MAKYTIHNFREQFPTDDACLDYLFKSKFGEKTGCPECSVESKFARVKGRRSYQCPVCSHQIYPTANTVFHKSTTPLTTWFYAIYLFTATRNGVAAKELERQLSVCYKTALRMAHQIKILMSDKSENKLGGLISADEAYFGMQSKNRHAKDALKVFNKPAKIAVVGMMEKDGRVKTELIRDHYKSGDSIGDIVKNNVDPNSTLVTDGAKAYVNMDLHFSKHVIINHHKDEYVKDGFSTNNIENYWSTLKRMIKGTHIHVSREHFLKYANENSFRYMHRGEPEKMMEKILANVNDR
jgi:transposase